MSLELIDLVVITSSGSLVTPDITKCVTSHHREWALEVQAKKFLTQKAEACCYSRDSAQSGGMRSKQKDAVG